MKTSHILLVTASLGSILLAMAHGLVNAKRSFLTPSQLRETYQRLEAYAARH